jgi:hypothetical protein
MAEAHWIHQVDGSFIDAADWSTGTVPGAADDAILDAAGALDYTVTTVASQTVAGIQTAAAATLGVDGPFTATNGTDGGVSAGKIAIANGGTLTVGGALDNTGFVTLAASNERTSLVVAATLSLTGGGYILMGDSADNVIVGTSPSATLTNVDNIIAGAGDLGDGELTLVNEVGGEIASNQQAAPLVIDTGAHIVVNAGVIEATGDGLTVMSPIDNTGGLKSDGGDLTVNGAVTGAGLGIVAGGTLRFNSSFNQEVAFQGASRGVLVLAQSVDYTGLVAGFSTTGIDSLDLGDIGFVGAGEATFSGTTTSGVLTVTDGTHTARIHLSGNYTGLAFVAGGDGRGGTTVTGRPGGPSAIHWLNPVSANFSTAADWTGGLAPGPANIAILDAPGATSYAVTASTSQTVAGIQTAASATLSVTGPFVATNGSDGGLSAGRIAIANGGTFTAGGTLDNTGFITLSASSGQASLVVAGALSLTGGGDILMGAGVGNIIVGSSPAATLTNVQDIIAGAGDLGDGALVLINEAGGEIASNQTSAPLIIDTGANTIVNAGVIEAAGDGATIMSPVDNTGYLKTDGGDLTVNGAVTGTGLGIIEGGTLRFNSTFNQEVVFSGSSGEALHLAKSVSYTAVITGFSTTGTDSLDLGDVAFGPSTLAIYSGTTSGGLLTVTSGARTARLHLSGNYTGLAFIARSDGRGGTTIVDATPTAVHWLNPVSANFSTAADWTAGVVPGPGADAILDAPGSSGYTVTASTGQTVAAIQTAANATLGVSGPFVATNGSGGGVNAGKIEIADGGSFTAGGTLDNAGLITLSASSGLTSLVAADALTLTGGGYVLMGNSADNIIVGSSKSATLTNVSNTIAGAGDLGNRELTLVNAVAGKIESDQPSKRLIIDTGNNTIVNAGLIEAEGAGLIVMSPIDNTGYLKAAGGVLTVYSAVTGTGLGIVAGGTLQVYSPFNQEVAFQGGGGLFLAQSVNYGGLIAGFSTTGTDSLELGDIAYDGSTRATYSGTTSGGVLTVTDGVDTAHIRFEGNYTASTFTASSDGHGGTIIVDPAAGPPATAHRFIAEAAALGGPAGAAIHTGEPWSGRESVLVNPRATMA